MNDPLVHEQAKKFAARVMVRRERRRDAHRPRVCAALRPRADGARRRRRRLSYLAKVSGKARRAASKLDAAWESLRAGAVPEQRVRVRGLNHAENRNAFAPTPSRRTLLRSMVGGSLAASRDRLASCSRAKRGSPRSARAEEAALRAEGQARHLAVLDRRRVARGHVRPEAEAVRGRRQDARRRRRAVARKAAAPEAALGRSSPAASAARRSATSSRTSATRWTTSASSAR